MFLPRTISNPFIGDKVTFLETTEETGGSHVTLLVELTPGGKNSLHFHTTYQEQFEVVEGELGRGLEKDFFSFLGVGWQKCRYMSVTCSSIRAVNALLLSK